MAIALTAPAAGRVRGPIAGAPQGAYFLRLFLL